MRGETKMDFLRNLFGKKQPAATPSSKENTVSEQESKSPADILGSMNQHEPRILVRGLYRIDLGHFLGHQEIHITLLERAADGDYERVMVKSISESGTRHILITGVLARTVFLDVHSNVVSLPNGDYSFALKDIPSSSQSQVFRDFAELRRSKPDKNHILVCSTYPEIASDCGIFDHLPEATDGAAVYVIGYGLKYSNLVANFYRCVNVPGKAKGFVHSIVSLYDSTRIINQDFDKLKSIANPVEKLQYFWDMEGLRYEPPPMPTLLGITAACQETH
jgi:hypothetical protein